MKEVLDLSSVIGKKVLLAGQMPEGFYNYMKTIIPAFFAPENEVAVLRKVPYSYEDGCGARHRCLVKTNTVFKGGYKLFPENDEKTRYTRKLPYGTITASYFSLDLKWNVYFNGWFVFEARMEDEQIVLRPTRDKEWDFIVVPLRHKLNSRASCAKLYYQQLDGPSTFVADSTCCAIESNVVGFVLARKGATFLVGRNMAYYRSKPENPVEVFRFTALSDFTGDDSFHEWRKQPYSAEHLGFFKSIEDAAESMEVEEVI